MSCYYCGHGHAFRIACTYPNRQLPTVSCGCRHGAALVPALRPRRARPATLRRAARYIPVTVRRAVIARDGHVCGICGGTCTTPTDNGPRGLTLDHLIPVSRGGSGTLENLRVACRSCNSRRQNPEVLHHAES